MLSAGGHSKYLATQIRSGCPSGVSIKGGLRLGPTGPKKHTPAAKKMGYLAADCYPVGEGKGRGVFWWKVLIVLSLVLSLVLSQVGGFHPENPQRLTPMEECKPCLEVTQKGQATTRNLKYQTHYDCQEDKKKEYCFFNGTQYQVCESEKGVVCHDPRAITKDGQSKAHEIYKQEAGKMPTIPVCDRCNRTVWIGGRKKFTFLGYYQINRLFYDKNKLEMCTTGGKMYWVGKNLKHEGKMISGNEPIVLDLLRHDDDRTCLQFDETFCFSKNEEGLDPESKMQMLTQELRRQESEAKRKRIEQERLKTLSEHYEQLEKQYKDWGLPAPNQNLFRDLMQEIATELGKLPHLHGLIFQWIEGQRYSLLIIEWVFFSHQRSKTITEPQELIAQLIQKARVRLCQLAGCDFACIHLPVKLSEEGRNSPERLTKEMFEHLLQGNASLQLSLDSYRGQISVHAPSHKLFNEEFHLIPCEKRSQRRLKAITVYTDVSGASHKSVMTWRNAQTQLWEADVEFVEGSPQMAELAAMVRTFEKFSEPINLVTDSAYVVGVVSRAEQAVLKEIENEHLFRENLPHTQPCDEPHPSGHLANAKQSGNGVDRASAASKHLGDPGTDTSTGKHMFVHCSSRESYVHLSGEKSAHAKQHLLQAFSVLGIPKEIKTDNGPAYVSKEFLEFIQQWGVERKTGIPYSPTGQAVVERAHQVLKQVLARQSGSTAWMSLQQKLCKASFTINFLNCSFENMSPPVIRHFNSGNQFKLSQRPPILIRDPETWETKGPYELVTWGCGYACVATPSGPRWIPQKWVKPSVPKLQL
ncbi:hypothetical protein HGM15179_015077 [Zosterops borbonicus]|uniref:Integrase n=1 Tax=Zosterops borbonicus TaxID=364589 RepID=A0A8K1G516_9PASS|nr:hypothetical protein HGM15179_015077 [Zosterops borbonicus]